MKKSKRQKDETVINRLSGCHNLVTHGYLSVPESEQCHSHAMTVKHFLTDYANHASLRLSFF